ncbi:MAG: hypothetical protein HY731_11360, partial [Candidatus Tectomicrobia bacterium]|nr:hypothetical protein [Candidatus Tectomicrobia bacterium]
GSTITYSIAWEQVTIAERSQVEGSIIGSHVEIDEGTSLLRKIALFDKHGKLRIESLLS